MRYNFRDLLQLGSSKPWQDAMEAMTGTRKMNVDALKEYFKPLQDWLKNYLGNEPLQWSEECSHMTAGDEARQWLEKYEASAEAAYSRSIEADWKFETDIRDETEWEKVTVFF